MFYFFLFVIPDCWSVSNPSLSFVVDVCANRLNGETTRMRSRSTAVVSFGNLRKIFNTTSPPDDKQMATMTISVLRGV